jgi:hypothetical protein
VHWVFIRDDSICQLETSYDQEDDRYLVTVHVGDGSTETECFQDANVLNMYLAAIESALVDAGFRPAVPNRPLFVPEHADKHPHLVH